MIWEMDDIKSMILEWNYNFPCDVEFRKKYNIPFNSKEHRKMCQIDIFFDIMESRVLDFEKNTYIEKYKKYIDYHKNGEMFKSDTEDDDRFDKFMPKDEGRFVDVNDL